MASKLPPKPKKGTKIFAAVWRPDWGYHEVREGTVIGGNNAFVFTDGAATPDRAEEGKTWIRADSPLAEGFRAKYDTKRDAIIEQKRAHALAADERAKQERVRQGKEHDDRVISNMRKAVGLVKAAEIPEHLQEVALAYTLDQLRGTLPWPFGFR